MRQPRSCASNSRPNSGAWKRRSPDGLSTSHPVRGRGFAPAAAARSAGGARTAAGDAGQDARRRQLALEGGDSLLLPRKPMAVAARLSCRRGRSLALPRGDRGGGGAAGRGGRVSPPGPPPPPPSPPPPPPPARAGGGCPPPHLPHPPP